MPLITVIIPTRNRRALLEEAIRSCLDAASFPYEILVSDNASSDDTPTIEAAYPQLRYLRRPELLPMADHWSLCVLEAKGKYVKILCDDDWLLPGALEREVTALEKDSRIVAAASARTEVSADGTVMVATKGFASDTLLSGAPLFSQMLVGENLLGPPSAVTFRREAFRGFPSAYHYAADWAAWILLAEQGPVAFLAKPGCAFRLHGANLTDRHVDEGTDFVEVMALRRECLARMPGAMPFAGRVFYWWIFQYRLLRRLVRLVRKGEKLGVFLRRALMERREPLAGTGAAQR